MGEVVLGEVGVGGEGEEGEGQVIFKPLANSLSHPSLPWLSPLHLFKDKGGPPSALR